VEPKNTKNEMLRIPAAEMSSAVEARKDNFIIFREDIDKSLLEERIYRIR
jgi:hypothetical protein